MVRAGSRSVVVRLALIGAMIVVVARAVRADPEARLPWTAVDAGGVVASASAAHRLGATLGQPEAASSTGADTVVVGGFWAIVRPAAAAVTATPTVTGTGTATTATPSRSATATASPTASPTSGSPTPTPSAVLSHTATPSVSPMASASGSPTATATPGGDCAGDCGGDSQVTVDEIVTLVNVALGLLPIEQCVRGDANGDGRITIDELLLAVLHTLNGCPAQAPADADARRAAGGVLHALM